jgi:hypothetical protein
VGRAPESKQRKRRRQTIALWALRDAAGRVVFCNDKIAYESLIEGGLAAHELSSGGSEPQWCYWCPTCFKVHLTRVEKNRWVTPAPRLTAIARALLDTPGGVLARDEMDALRWGYRGTERLRRALVTMERRGMIRRDEHSVTIIDRVALTDLAVDGCLDPEPWVR